QLAHQGPRPGAADRTRARPPAGRRSDDRGLGVGCDLRDLDPAARRRRAAGIPRSPQIRGVRLTARNQLPELALVLVRHDIERAVGPLAHVADTLPAVRKQVLLAGDPLSVDLEPYQTRARHAANEHAVLPAREQVAGVPLHPGRRDHRTPGAARLHVAVRGRGRAGDRIPAILDTVRLHGPAVVLAGADEVELVASARPMLDQPEAVLRVERERLDVPVPV